MILTIRAFRTKNISAKAIHLGQWLNDKKQGIPRQKCFNHWEVSYIENDVILTSGSRADGTTTVEFIHWLAGYRKAEVKEWNIELTEGQWQRVKNYLNEAENTPYEHSIFWQYPKMILSGIWKGDNTANELFCVEHVIRAINAACVIPVTPFYAWPNELMSILDNNFNH